MADGDSGDPMAPETWFRTPGVCGSCIAWRPLEPEPGEEVAAGTCKLRPELRRVPATLKLCTIYKPRGNFHYDPVRDAPRTSPRRRSKTVSVLRRSAEGVLEPQVTVRGRPAGERPPPRWNEGPEPDVIYEDEAPEEPQEPAEEEATSTVTSTSTGTAAAASTPVRREEPPRPPPPEKIDLGGEESVPVIRQALVELIRQEHGRTLRELHPKFKRGGRAVATRPDGPPVEVPAERVFAMLDRLKSSLEQLRKRVPRYRDGLGEELATEITATLKTIEGSFTTFNVLFSDREDYFSSK